MSIRRASHVTDLSEQYLARSGTLPGPPGYPANIRAPDISTFCMTLRCPSTLRFGEAG
ncbi:hypothetical protein JYU34_005463, partial [Plutella xylostella]